MNNDCIGKRGIDTEGMEAYDRFEIELVDRVHGVFFSQFSVPCLNA